MAANTVVLEQPQVTILRAPSKSTLGSSSRYPSGVPVHHPIGTRWGIRGTSSVGIGRFRKARVHRGISDWVRIEWEDDGDDCCCGPSGQIVWLPLNLVNTAQRWGLR